MDTDNRGYRLGYKFGRLLRNRKVRWGLALGTAAYFGARSAEKRMGKTMFTMDEVKQIVKIDRICQQVKSTYEEKE